MGSGTTSPVMGGPGGAPPILAGFQGAGAAPRSDWTAEAGAASGIASGVTSFLTAYDQSEAQKLQGEFQAYQFTQNKKLAEIAAADAIERGDYQAGQVRLQGRQLKGQQRVAYAAQGIDPNTGSAAQVQGDTERFTELDALMVKNNAWKEAWGYKMDALNSQGKAAFALSSSKYAANNTLLTGGLQFANTVGKTALWYSKNS